jgi:hypothetical protein
VVEDVTPQFARKIPRLEELAASIFCYLMWRELVLSNFNTSLPNLDWDSSVGIAAGYGLDGPRIESWYRQDFSQTSRLALGPTQPLVEWVLGLSRV